MEGEADTKSKGNNSSQQVTPKAKDRKRAAAAAATATAQAKTKGMAANGNRNNVASPNNKDVSNGRRERKQKFDVRKLLNIRGSTPIASAGSKSTEEEGNQKKRRSGRVKAAAEAAAAAHGEEDVAGVSVSAVNGAAKVEEASPSETSVLVSGKRERKRKRFWDEQDSTVSTVATTTTTNPPPAKVVKKQEKKGVSSSSSTAATTNTSASNTLASAKPKAVKRERKPSSHDSVTPSASRQKKAVSDAIASSDGPVSVKSSNSQSLTNNGRTLDYLKFDLSEPPENIASQMVEGKNIPGAGMAIPVDSSSLPNGWEKRVIQRGIGITKGKWDVFIVNPDGKSFRSKIDVQRHIDEKKLPLTSESFDFSLDSNLKRLRQIWKQYVAIPQKLLSRDQEDKKKAEVLEPPVVLPAEVPVVAEVSPPCPDFAKESETGQGLRCTIEKCNKLFRNDRLLHMHVKHYHPNFFGLYSQNSMSSRISSHDDTLAPSTLTPPLAAAAAAAIATGQPAAELDELGEASFKRLEKRRKLSVSSAEKSDKRSKGEGDVLSGKRGPGRPPLSRKGIEETDDATRVSRTRNDSILSVGSEASCTNENPSSSPITFRMSKRRQAQLSKKKNLSPVLQMSKVEDTADGRCYLEEYVSFISGATGNGLPGDGSAPSSYPPSEMDASVASEHLTSEEVVNCTCKRTEEDGLMIQCDICLCWQHGNCLGIDEEDQVPDKHVCQICRDPPGARTNIRFAIDQDWVKEGRLPRVTANAVEQQAFKKLSELMADLSNLSKVLHSLRVKLFVASQRNNSKVFMWSSPWEPEPQSEPILTSSPLRNGNGSSSTNLFPPLPSDNLHLPPPHALAKKGEVNGFSPPSEKSEKTPNGFDELSSNRTLPGEPKNLDLAATTNGAAVSSAECKATDKSKTHLEEDLQNLDPSLIPSVSEVERLLPSILQESLQDQLNQVGAPAPVPPQVIIPEQKRIDKDECRLNLLTHIANVQQQLGGILDSVETNLTKIEQGEPVPIATPEQLASKTKTLAVMLTNDLLTARKMVGSL